MRDGFIKGSGWLDAKKTLPPYFEDVLIYYFQFGKPRIDISRKTADGEKMCDVFLHDRCGSVDANSIIAWMPVEEIIPPSFIQH